MNARRFTALALCFLSVQASSAGAAARVAPAALARVAPAATQAIDNSQFIDINNIRMFVTNTGSVAWDKTSGNAGLEYPKGSGKTAVFSAGPWLGAMVGGQVRLALSEYSDEYGPGSMVGGLADNPNNPDYRVYKLYRTYADIAVRDAALADYNAGAVPHGAPAVTVQGDGTLNIPGDEMMWCVFNDADPFRHTTRAGSTSPLGVEVQLTAFAYMRPGPLDRTIFLRYKIINQGFNTLQDLHMGMWCDPDLGYAGDDLVGCDPARSTGFVYNATNLDALYGSAPPSVGIDLLRGPLDASNTPLHMTAFESYINGMDPDQFSKSYSALRGLDQAGLPVTDPSTGLVTTFWQSGDPIAGTGWIDSGPADKRFLVSAGPVGMSPGQSQEVTYAIVIGQGSNRLASIQSMRCDDDQIQAFFDRSFALPYPIEPVCPQYEIVNCPLTADDWYQQFAAGGGDYSADQLAEIARRVDDASTFFNWGIAQYGSLTAALNPATNATLLGRATREFAAFQCNLAASDPPIHPSGGLGAFLEPSTPIACQGLTAQNINEFGTASVPGLEDASYLNLNAAHPTALEGASVGGTVFGGGANTADPAFFSSLSATTEPDSFMSVEIRFDRTQTQQAYRYLRLETSSGTHPAHDFNNYIYGGFRTVPFTCWDVDHNVQLDVGFMERTVCDDYGTILPPAMQLATFDSTWAPDNSSYGGFEYVIVYRRPYDGTPKAELAIDNALHFTPVPALYSMLARLVSPTSVIDDGDHFRFKWGFAPSSSADARLLQLAALVPGDPAAIQGYSDIAACLSDINAGIGIGQTCFGATATLISLAGADATTDRVTVSWLVSSSAAQLRVERREGSSGWADLGAVQPDGRGMIVFGDANVVAGKTYGYRLRVSESGGIQFAGETSVVVPLRAVLSLEGLRPNPAGRGAQISFSLASTHAATITVFDVAGRKRLSRDVGTLGPGAHLLPLAGELPSGLYMLRLTQDSRSVTRKAMIVR